MESGVCTRTCIGPPEFGDDQLQRRHTGSSCLLDQPCRIDPSSQQEEPGPITKRVRNVCNRCVTDDSGSAWHRGYEAEHIGAERQGKARLLERGDATDLEQRSSRSMRPPPCLVHPITGVDVDRGCVRRARGRYNGRTSRVRPSRSAQAGRSRVSTARSWPRTALRCRDADKT